MTKTEDSTDGSATASSSAAGAVAPATAVAPVAVAAPAKQEIKPENEAPLAPTSPPKNPPFVKAGEQREKPVLTAALTETQPSQDSVQQILHEDSAITPISDIMKPDPNRSSHTMVEFGLHDSRRSRSVDMHELWPAWCKH